MPAQSLRFFANSASVDEDEAKSLSAGDLAASGLVAAGLNRSLLDPCHLMSPLLQQAVSTGPLIRRWSPPDREEIDGAAGLLLHPAIDQGFHEHVVIQNHPITFATVNLTGTATAIRNELWAILCPILA